MTDQEQKIEKKRDMGALSNFSERTIEGKNSFKEQLMTGKGVEQAGEATPGKLAEEKIQKNIGIELDGRGADDKKEIKIHAEDISRIQDAQMQIEKLVELAIAENPIKAINVARRLDENYVLDGFHDKLVEDEIKKVLAEKGLFEKN